MLNINKLLTIYIFLFLLCCINLQVFAASGSTTQLKKSSETTLSSSSKTIIKKERLDGSLMHPYRGPSKSGNCGDGILNMGSGEQCDDGNQVSGDGCSQDCQIEVTEVYCGNGILEGREQCDDGNTTDGDGCSSACKFESTTSTQCGNSILEANEECDDGNQVSGDGCSDHCTIEDSNLFPCQFECTDTDLGLNPANSQGSVFGTYATGLPFSINDSCFSPSQVLEHSCTTSGYSNENIDCPAGTFCQDGACVTGAVSFNCTDTDQANDPTYAGNVSGNNVDGSLFSQIDECTPDGINVIQYNCEATYVSAQIGPCPTNTTCTNGACVPITDLGTGGTGDTGGGGSTSTTVNCLDSDGGSNPIDSRGNVSGNFSNGAAFNIDDSCVPDGTQVIERSCSATGYIDVYMDCPSGTVCVAGACIACDCTH